MSTMISEIVSQLGISEDQAQGAIGALADLAKKNLDGDSFSQLSSALPELSNMLGKGPEASEGGMGAMLGSALGGVMGGSAGNLAALTGSFKALGLDAEMVAKFLPVVLEYAQKNGGDTIQQILKKIV